MVLKTFKDWGLCSYLAKRIALGLLFSISGFHERHWQHLRVGERVSRWDGDPWCFCLSVWMTFWEVSASSFIPGFLICKTRCRH